MGENGKECVRIRVSLLLRREDGKLCMVRHLKAGQRYWLLPGGGQNMCEPVFDTAKRELKEEINAEISGLEFFCARETMNRQLRRHILFLVYKGLNPDFSGLCLGSDPRIEGIDFFSVDEMADRPVFPDMKSDLTNYLEGKSVELFKSLEWVSLREAGRNERN